MEETYVTQRLALPGGDLSVLQPEESAELPDDGPIEWAPVAPYWSVLWRSGMALAQELANVELGGLRVVELGCGLGVPSLVAARRGASVLATDHCDEALALLERNAHANGLRLETALVDWREPGELLVRAPFDLVLAADVLYERPAVAQLLKLLPQLASEVWLADPGRPAADAFLEQAAASWSVVRTARDGMQINRLKTLGARSA